MKAAISAKSEKYRGPLLPKHSVIGNGRSEGGWKEERNKLIRMFLEKTRGMVVTQTKMNNLVGVALLRCVAGDCHVSCQQNQHFS